MKLSFSLLFVGLALGLGAGYWYWGGGSLEIIAVEEEKIIGRALTVVQVAETTDSAAGMAAAIVPPAEDADYSDKSDYLKVLAVKDPRAAIAWADANSTESERDDLYRVIAKEWAKKDPRAAFDWAQTLTLSIEREDAIVGVMGGILEGGNVELALRLSEELPPGEYRDEATKAIVKLLATQDLERAMTLTAAMGQTYEMRNASKAIAEALIEEGRFDELRQRVEALPFGSLRQQMVAGMLQQLGASDVHAAMAWISDRPIGPDGDELFNRSALQNSSYYLSRELVREGDLETAFAWVQGLPDKNMRDHFDEQIGEAWAQRSPGEASSWLIGEISERGHEGLERIASGIFEEWLEVDQVAPFEMIAQIANADTRNWAAQQALNDLSGENPRLAAQRLETWNFSDPQLEHKVASRMMGNWLRRDAGEASEWLSRQPQGRVKDGGIEQLVHSVLREERDFATAEAWIGEVQDGKLVERLKRDVEVYRKTKGNDPFQGGVYEERDGVVVRVE